jgi:group I intron endonuclease
LLIEQNITGFKDNFIPGIFVKFDDIIKKEIYGIIYIAYNKITNKMYIGQTKLSLKERQKQHLRAKGHTKFKYAVKKYENDFVWSIHDTAYSKIELDEKEKYWIKFYKSNTNDFGYNLTAGGDGRCEYKHKKESNDKRAESNRKYNTNKFYQDYNVNDILNYMKNNEATFTDCTKYFNISSTSRLKKFFKKEFSELYQIYLERSEKIRHKRTAIGLKGIKHPGKMIKVDISMLISLIEPCKSFKEIANILSVNPAIVKNRLQEYDRDLYDITVKKYNRNRNIAINNKRYGIKQ